MATNDQVEHSNEDGNSSLDQKSCKPCYYPSQISVAKLLFERIELILWHYQEKTLSNFKKFDFRIYSARFNELEKQGIERLCEPDAECFGSGEYKNPSELNGLANSKVWKYVESTDLNENLKALKKNVDENPNKLFLIVADEADWGTAGNESANNQLVNYWDDNQKNVIVLLVTATPFNLLTENKRIPDLNVVRNIEDQKLEIVLGNERCDVVDAKKLHVVKWDENYEDRLTEGLLVKLWEPQRVGERKTWMKLTEVENSPILRLNITYSKEDATPFFISGKNNVVRIESENKQKICVEVKIDGRYDLVFCSSSDKLPEGWERVSDSFKLNFNEDILKFRGTSKNSSLEYYVFLIESIDNSSIQYLSLNFFFNTMRNEDLHKQLIREDKNFQEMCNHTTSLHPLHVLASEYAYYIVLINSIRSFCLGKPSDWENDPFGTLQSAWKQYSTSRSNNLSNLKMNLSYQISEKFQLVVDKIENKCYEDLRLLLEQDGNHDFNSFAQRLVLWLIHANIEHSDNDLLLLKIHDLIERTYSQKFKEFCSHFDEEKKDNVLCKSSETYKIVNNLIANDTSERTGHMKIIRVKKIENGNFLYDMLVKAKAIGFTDEHPFEIIRYFGDFKISDKCRSENCLEIWKSLQHMKCSYYSQSGEKCECETFKCEEKEISCRNCFHPHNVVKSLSDLESLPCIVIVVDNCRRGTTLPLSFNVLDLRLIQQGAFVPLVQQLGRMCQYRERIDYQSLPYALVVPELVTTLKKTLRESVVFNDCSEYFKIDSHITQKNEASLNSSDYKNKDLHNNRILIWAEPQIGKTGAYLNLISRLRKTIENSSGREDDISESSGRDESTSDMSGDEEEISSGVNNCEMNWKTKESWEYPYWKFMENSENILTTTGENKYNKCYEPYKYGELPKLRSEDSQDPVSKSSKKAKTNIKEPEIDNVDNVDHFRAYCYCEHACSDCRSSEQFKIHDLVLTGFKEPGKICVPYEKRFKPLFDKLNLEKQDKNLEELFMRMNISEDLILDTWIFNPTYRRATQATINYHHTMVANARYVQILVVRASEFDSYVERWGTTHAILTLPETMEGVDAKTGGIGYARRFIQMFAEHCNLPKIFVLDDNIYRIYQVKFAKQDGEVQRADEYRLEKVKFWSVLKHLESFFDCSQPLPVKDKFDKYSLEETYCCNQSNGIHTYTGTPNLYGILGVMKLRRQRVNLQGFNRGHVHSLVLLNITKLKSKEIKYKSFRVYEDLDMNNQCDENGLFVCKFNKYRMLKKQLKSNIMVEDGRLHKKTTNTKSNDPSSQNVKSEVMKQDIQSVDNYVASIDEEDFVIYNKRTGKTRNLSRGTDLGDEEEIRLNQIRTGSLYDYVIQKFEIKRQGQIKNDSENQEELQMATD